MSGTSLDGVDVALIETNGERIAGLGPTGYRPYSDAERDLLRQAIAEGGTLTDRWQRTGVLADPFFGLRARKSLDRNAFAFGNIGLPDYSLADGAATLSALNVQAVGRILPHLPAVPKS